MLSKESLLLVKSILESLSLKVSDEGFAEQAVKFIRLKDEVSKALKENADG